MPRLKQVTYTTQVFEWLTKQNDFATHHQVQSALGITRPQALASLVHLRKYKAVDCIVEPDGVSWWFATPEADSRTKVLVERTPEAKPRRTRRTAKASAGRSAG